MLVFLASFALYAATLSSRPTGDSIAFAQSVELLPLSKIVEAHQLAAHPVAWAWFWTWSLLGWSGGALFPLQVLNAIAGAACVVLLFVIVWGIAQRSAGIALMVAAGFGVSYGAWALSTQAEFVTLPLALALAALAAMLWPGSLSRPNAGRAVLLGFVAGIAAAAYQTNLFLIAAGMAGYLLIPDADGRARVRRSVVFALAALVTYLVPYLISLYTVFGVRSSTELASWRPRSGIGNDYYSFAPSDIAHGAYAFVRTLAGYRGIGLNDSTGAYLTTVGNIERMAFVGYYAFWSLVVVVSLSLIYRNRRRLWSGHRTVLVVMGTWTLLNAVFAVYWVPGDVSFWLPVLLGWWAIVGTTGCLLWVAPAREASVPPTPARFRTAIVLVLLAMLAICNAVAVVR